MAAAKISLKQLDDISKQSIKDQFQCIKTKNIVGKIAFEKDSIDVAKIFLNKNKISKSMNVKIGTLKKFKSIHVKFEHPCTFTVNLIFDF